MKKLLLLFPFLLFAHTAQAQVGPEVYRIATPAQISAFVTAEQYSAMTAASLNQMLEVTCQTGACYIWINSSGQTYPASTTTGASGRSSSCAAATAPAVPSASGWTATAMS